MPFKPTKQKYYIVREDICGSDFVTKRVKIELTNEDLNAIWYSITNTCYLFGDELPNVVNKIRKVLD